MSWIRSVIESGGDVDSCENAGFDGSGWIPDGYGGCVKHFVVDNHEKNHAAAETWEEAKITCELQNSKLLYLFDDKHTTNLVRLFSGVQDFLSQTNK